MPRLELEVIGLPLKIGSVTTSRVPIRAIRTPTLSLEVIFSLRKNQPPKIIKTGLVADRIEA